VFYFYTLYLITFHLVRCRNVTSQEAEGFEWWPGWDEVDGGSRTLQRPCFYLRTPLISQPMLALFQDIPEFGTWIVPLRTFWLLYISTVIMVNYCVCVCMYVCVCVCVCVCVYVCMYVCVCIYIYFNETEIWAYILLASYKVPDFLAPPLTTFFFSLKRFLQKSPITNFTEITDGRTNVTKHICASRNDTTAPKTAPQFFVDFLLQN